MCPRAAAALLCALAACAPRVREAPPARVEAVAVGGATVRLEYGPQDEREARRVAAALAWAVPRAEQWGPLRAPVTIVLQPSHAALEAAVHRPGYPWLRAWARYDAIELQSPRTWNRFFPPAAAELEELLAHELTHCAMYQQAGSAWSWPWLEIPLWFREGMASVTAGQGYKRTRPAELRAFWARPSGGAADGVAGSAGGARAGAAGDPIADPEPLYQAQPELVYGAAHLAFQFLLDRYGADRVRQVLAGMREGHAFPGAFRRAIGLTPAEFEGEFRRYVAWQDWAGR
ncbi:hypothetical protein [Anaeromyxobacter diazotrophicus]|uniref:Peptidase MA-like domain-containing protein n=1 Tax=Anaeromyxobacter diazotrophicus TaxID=2590199 RepID=A0A7I9VIW7_9BACT|nr:hypothetical protein [Anaeromyxobacter diazotrophicus]GEJ56351.1 hypothetical protein AMYX_10920 [Anaeromyxobacter diazotrophicus]